MQAHRNCALPRATAACRDRQRLLVQLLRTWRAPALPDYQLERFLQRIVGSAAA